MKTDMVGLSLTGFRPIESLVGIIGPATQRIPEYELPVSRNSGGAVPQLNRLRLFAANGA